MESLILILLILLLTSQLQQLLPPLGLGRMKTPMPILFIVEYLNHITGLPQVEATGMMEQSPHLSKTNCMTPVPVDGASRRFQK